MAFSSWFSPCGFAKAKKAGGLVAISCAHRDALAALGAAARQNCSSAFSLHAAAKPMGLRAAAAIRLKCALRHGSALLKKFFNEIMDAVHRAGNYSVQQFLSISHCTQNRKIRGFVLLFHSRSLPFHNRWCNSNRATQFASKVRFQAR